MSELNGYANDVDKRAEIFTGAMIDTNDYDLKLTAVMRAVGASFQYICYAIGGKQRSDWVPSEGNLVPPRITVADMQAGQASFWSSNVCAKLSPWIDLDSEDVNVQMASADAISEEFEYIRYLGCSAVMVTLKHRDSPKLAQFLRDLLWTQMYNLRIWIVFATNENVLLGQEGNEDGRDLWTVWADMRTALLNHRLVAVCLRLTLDLDDEFIEPNSYRRWMAEPLVSIWIDAELFVYNSMTNKLELSLAHRGLVQELSSSQSMGMLQPVISSRFAAKDPVYLAKLKDVAMKYFISGHGNSPHDSDPDFSGFDDKIQVPLQPLSDNLDSHTYEVFEKDSVKYEQYREAIVRAATQLRSKVIGGQAMVVMVVGAGRGPLISAVIQAETDIRFNQNEDAVNFDVIAIEKNRNSVISLHYLNETKWNNRVTIIQADMRHFEAPVQPDILISELLGSFGDNELSPECLDGANRWLKPHTISIPQSYTSYLAPLQSFKLHAEIFGYTPSKFSFLTKRRSVPVFNASKNRYEDEIESSLVPFEFLDQPYIVKLRNSYNPAEPQPLFTFYHPNRSGSTNERDAKLTFVVQQNSEICGFSGYFEANLFEDITLSILPSTYTKDLISWFPVVFPLRHTIRLSKGRKISIEMKRKVDTCGVWYEWRTEYERGNDLVATDWQNRHAYAYYIRL